MLTTTLKEIRENSPCTDGWETLLKHLGKTGAEAKHDETPLPIMTVLDSNGLDDALWVLDACIDPYICRLFAADCAERVLHIFENEYPNDKRPRKAIEVARDPNATNAALTAAGNAALDAAGDASIDPNATTDAGNAALDAAWAVTGDAELADGGSERKAQESRLRQYLTHGEAAKDMPWAE